MSVALEARAPVDNLVRARHDIGTIELRADADGTGRTLHGHFAVFNRWTEIDSWYEGRFIERIAPGAFTRTFTERGDKIRVLYDHGHDPSIGNKPLAVPNVLREDATGAYYEAELFEASYVDDLMPALRAGQLGASFRFKVTQEEWVEPTKATRENAGKLPERTISEVELYEFGPVTFPAYDDATAGVRSGSDQFIERLLSNEEVLARYIERAGPNVAAKFLASLPTIGRSDTTDLVEVDPPESTDGDSTEEGVTADGDTSENPDATVVDQTEGNRNQIAEALQRFRHQHRKEAPDVDQ
jgi:HK97 family phage prohead protease